MSNDRLRAAAAALASLSVVPTQLQRACETVRSDCGATVAVVDAAWRSFAAACGAHDLDAADSDSVGRRFFVGPDLVWLLGELAELSGLGDAASAPVDEFACVLPAAILGRNAKYADPTMQLWQNGYTPVTVHRVPVNTDVGVVEVVAAVVRPTPPLKRTARPL